MALLTCIILIVTGAVPAFAAAPTVVLNGKTISCDVSPQITGSYQLVPLRAVFTAMGATVSWDGRTRTATATKGDTTVIFPLNFGYPTINSVPYILPAAPKIVNGRILAPLNFVVDAFGAQAVWDAATRTVTIADGPDSRILIKSRSAGGFDLIQHKIVEGNTDLLYPTVTDMKDTAAQMRINDTIEKEVYSYRQLAWTGRSDPRTRYAVRYKVGLNESGLCSLVFTQSACPYHAAHPASAQLSLTFDGTGKMYQLKDLFSEHSDYVGRISGIVKQQFRKPRFTMLKPFETIRPDQDYYLTPAGITIYFQNDEYTPDADGFPEFLIPFTDVRDMLAPRSPVRALLKP